MNFINRTLLILGLVLAACPSAQAGPQWVIRKDKDGIKIYTAKLPNESFRAVKVECFMNATADQLLAVLLDINNNHEWVYKTIASEIVKPISDRELIYHAQMECPWPFSNRDIIAHLKIARQSPSVITISSQAKPDLLPTEEDVVRIRSSKAQWTITDMKDQVIKVEYTIQFDPGGNIPPWLLNLFITDGPYESFRKMKERVDLPAYQHAQFDI